MSRSAAKALVQGLVLSHLSDEGLQQVMHLTTLHSDKLLDDYVTRNMLTKLFEDSQQV